jgi:hypothetical protein
VLLSYKGFFSGGWFSDKENKLFLKKLPFAEEYTIIYSFTGFIFDCLAKQFQFPKIRWPGEGVKPTPYTGLNREMVDRLAEKGPFSRTDFNFLVHLSLGTADLAANEFIHLF